MPARSRKILIALIVGYHAAIMVGGSCLHGLASAWHGDRPTPIVAIAPDEPGGSQPGHGDDCPVCHFLAQAQLAVDPAPSPATAASLVVTPFHAAPRTIRPTRSPSRPRAPPSAPFLRSA